MEEKSFWKSTSEEKLQEYEDAMIKISGVKAENFKSYRVDIELHESEYLNPDVNKKVIDKKKEYEKYIWTYEIKSEENSEEKPTIILVHGYGGSGIIYYKVIYELSKEYNIIMCDLLGMGRSSRPKFLCKIPEECENFFVLALEKWRQKMGLENMILCSHSFGGFISGRYA